MGGSASGKFGQPPGSTHSGGIGGHPTGTGGGSPFAGKWGKLPMGGNLPTGGLPPNIEELMQRFSTSPHRGMGHRSPWQGGLQQRMNQWTNPGAQAVTNPGSPAASHGAPTPTGITAPGDPTGATASPANANPHANQPATTTPNQPGRGGHYGRQLIQALRNRSGG